MILLWLVLILIFSFLLIKATDILVISLKSISSRTKIGKFAITSLLLALATSLPELFVGLTAALEGKPSLALGNVVGSNIANISLVIGGAALLGGTVTVRGEFLKKDVFYAFLAGAAPMVLLIDKNLTRIDGLILLALYAFYNIWILSKRQKKLAEARDGEGEDFVRRFLRKLNHKGMKRDLAWLFLGVALLLFSADILVKKDMQIPCLPHGMSP